MLALGGPEIPFRPGRRDSKVSPPEGRLPAYTNCESFLDDLFLFCVCDGIVAQGFVARGPPAGLWEL